MERIGQFGGERIKQGSSVVVPKGLKKMSSGQSGVPRYRDAAPPWLAFPSHRVSHLIDTVPRAGGNALRTRVASKL
jgi:hypothetical protein